MLVCLLALLIAGIAFAVVEIRRGRVTLVRQMQTLAEVVATQSQAAMVFQDNAAASENLAALRANPDVLAGALVLHDDTPLAIYKRNPSTLVLQCRDCQNEGVQWKDGRLIVVRLVRNEGEIIGRLILQVSLNSLKTDLARGLTAGSTILILSIILAGLLATRLQKTISQPVRRLSRGIRTVAETRDYTIRVKESSNDELGALTQGFNEMLMQIQHQEKQLATHKNHLEQLVQERTEALEQSMNRVNRLAFFDELTGLANRTLFRERIELALAHAKHHTTPFAIFFLDIDRFKRVNDTFGHHIGDLLLKEVAQRLTVCFSDEDTGDGEQNLDHCISRLGGDEFNILLPDIGDAHEIALIARRVIDAVAQPMSLEGYEMVMTTSIGISVFPGDGRSVDSLIKNADTAMYHAKTEGRNNYQFYRESMNATALKRLALETDLRRAIEAEELEVYFQPQVDLDTHLVTGAEALVRWHHPRQGAIPPTEFIPVAEESGLIATLTEWVLREACRQACLWQHAGFPELRMSVNLSGYQFGQQNVTEMVRQALQDYPIKPANLELELTENSLVQNRVENIQILDALKQLGVQLAVDDFGTGYSSLVYLKTFPIDTLKIDRSFVRDISTDPNDAAITRAIVAMAKSLDLDLVAEGVETQEQLLFLKELGCRRIQGFFFGRPVPAKQFEQYLLDENKIAMAH